jgi:tetratricopeptide (TPR) repeat protein
MLRRFLVPVVIVTTLLMVAVATWRDAMKPAAPIGAPLAIVESTTRADLSSTIAHLKKRVLAQPEDGQAVVRLAQALIRIQRVDSDAGAVIVAEQHLRAFLAKKPDHYEAQRALGSVLLSQHRFRDAIREGERARAMDPRDAWNYGVIGDGHLELGEYDEAFAAFDRMGALRPGPAAYARVAYALELKGDLDGALSSMRMAADGTSAHDAEGQAWHYAQLGNLLLQRGRIGDARREFERAAFTFPEHPYATAGLARVKIAEGDHAGALALYESMHAKSPTPETAAILGDLQGRLGHPDRAEQMYVEAERLERDGWASEEPQPQALARFLAERGRKIPEAVALAEQAAEKRRDVHTMDALAWAYFRAGRIADAEKASAAALRTGTREPRILYHAAAIRAHAGDAAGARAVLSRLAAPSVELDLMTSRLASTLLATLASTPAIERAKNRS